MAAPLTRERRATPRVSMLEGTRMEHARLRPGRIAHIVDLSAGGALIETDWRLLPGTRVELRLGEAPASFTVEAQIVRCEVALLSRERIQYRGALAFERRLSCGELATPRVVPGS